VTLPFVHAGHLAYGSAIAGIVALYGYDWLRERRRS
jgi:hypothetical protein